MRLVRICGCLLFLLVVACKKDEVDIRTPEERLSQAMSTRWNFDKVERATHKRDGTVIEGEGILPSLDGVPGDYMSFTSDGKVAFLFRASFQPGVEPYESHGIYEVVSDNEFDMNIEAFGVSRCRVDTLTNEQFIFTDRYFLEDGKYAVSKYYLSK